MTTSVGVLQRVEWPSPFFADRTAAGRALAEQTVSGPDPEALVLALPRGGVPVAVPLAEGLGCELRPVAVRKLPVPTSPEMGFGAVTLDGTVTFNHAAMRSFAIGMGQAALIVEQVRREVERRAAAYPGALELPRIEGRTVYVVDDGLATGYTMIATCEMVRQHQPAEVIVAVPVAPSRTIDIVAEHCDAMVVLVAQEGVGGFAVAAFYDRFPDLTDAEVVSLLAQIA